MKQVGIIVYVVVMTNDDGDTYVYLYQTREQAINHMYEHVKENWTYTFGSDDGDDDIDDYEKEEAINHYYEYGSNGHYSIERETVSYNMMDLQEAIAKAMGLATHG